MSSTNIFPLFGLINPDIISTNVDLPQPLGPVTPKKKFLGIIKLKFFMILFHYNYMIYYLY